MIKTELRKYRENLNLNKKEEWRRKTFIPFEERKTILLLSDDYRMPSGVGTMSKHIVLKTIHHFHICQLGGSIKHPEEGKIIDMSQEIERITGIKNYSRIYPISGYGNPDILREIIKRERPDALIHFTDPRFWIWLYNMEHEIRQQIPILYYNIWDDLPFPVYNRPYYESCDALFAISKQTYNINKQVINTGDFAEIETLDLYPGYKENEEESNDT